MASMQRVSAAAPQAARRARSAPPVADKMAGPRVGRPYEKLANIPVLARDDPREQLAEKIAAQALRAPPAEAAARDSMPPTAAGTSGAPLDAAARAYFEPRFGRDFGAVRVHTDAPAGAAARSLGAAAFTIGADIGFAAGRYSPASVAGRGLLAHELAHVAQLAGGPLVLALQRVEQYETNAVGFDPVELGKSAEFGYWERQIGAVLDLSEEAKNIQPITWYAASDAPKELFAESFGLYYSDPEWLKENWPDLYNFFNNLDKTGMPPTP